MRQRRSISGALAGALAVLAGSCYAPHRPYDNGDAAGSDTNGTMDATGSPSTSTISDTTATTDATQTSSAASDSGDGTANDSTGSPQGCGDGIVDGVELCDDGDGVDGNGCNNDCTPSGTPIWTATYDGPAHLDDRPSGIAVASDDSVVVVGSEGAEPNSVALLLRYDADGGVIWQQTFEVGGAGGEASGVAISLDDEIVISAFDNTASAGVLQRYDLQGALDDEIPLAWAPIDVVVDDDDVLYTCGRVDAMLGPWHTRLASFSAFGNLNWEIEDVEAVQSQCRALSLLSTGMVVLTDRDHVATLERRDPGGQSLWSRAFADLSGEGVATWDDDHSVVAGHIQDAGMGVTAFDEDGVIGWMDLPDLGQSWALGVAVDLAGNVVVVGTVGSLAFGSDALVAKYSPDGELWWYQHWDVHDDRPMNDTQAIAVAIGSDDSILVAGSESIDDLPLDVWIRKLSR